MYIKKHKWFKLLKARFINYSSYRNYSNVLKKLLKAAECNYYRQKLKQCDKDSSKKWKIINSLTRRSTGESSVNFNINDNITKDQHVIAEAFSNYFSSLPYKVIGQLPASTIDGLNHLSRIDHTMFLFECSPSEVKRYMLLMRCADRDNDVSIKMLKINIDCFAIIICKLFNLYLSSGSYPDILKEAQITPIYKAGPRNKIENRPISILKNLNKMFE